MGKHVGQDDERKREGWEEDIQERIEKNKHAYIVEEFPWFWILLQCSLYLKLARLTRKNQSLSKLWQFRKWKAEILDTLLGLHWQSYLKPA